MPPRIRSPTPSSSEEDQLADSPQPVSGPVPPAAASYPVSTTSSSTGVGALPHEQLSDDLSSLSSEVMEESEEEDDDEPARVALPESESEPESDDVDDDDGDEFEQPDEEEDDDEMDELYDGAAASAKKAAPPPQQQPSSSVKIKFKLGGGGGAGASKATASLSNPARPSGRSAVKWTPSTASASKKGKGKKRKHDELSDFSDEFSDASGDSNFSGARLTARQRAKEMGGEFGMELQSLPNAVVPLKPPVKLTEAEIALRRSENSRKRKHQSDKKLEDEKTETINRLLKKQVGKQRSKLSTSVVANPNNQSAGGTEDDDRPTPAAVREVVPVGWRWVSSIKNGEYTARVGIVGDLVALGEKRDYPGPRPPPKTRRLTVAAS